MLPVFHHASVTRGGTSLNAVLAVAVHRAGKLFCSTPVGQELQTHGRTRVCDVISGEFDGSVRFKVLSYPFLRPLPNCHFFQCLKGVGLPIYVRLFQTVGWRLQH